MAKKQHIIKERLSQMFTFGAEPHELINCLKDSKQKLIIAGAKADNLPKTMEKRLIFLSTLSPKARSIVLTWFRTNVKFPERGEPEKILNELLLKENSDNETQSLKLLWRDILGFYISQPCPEIIEQFINDEKIKVFSAEESEESEEVNNSIQEHPVIDLTDEDIDQLLSIRHGHDISSSIRVIPMFVAGLIETFNGQAEAASIWKEKLSAHPAPIVQKLESIIAEFESENKENEAKSAPILVADSAVSEDLDEDIDNIYFIGIVTKLLPSGVFFVSPVGLLINGKLRDLSEKQAKILFPHNGEVVGFINRFAKSVMQGEMGIWQARHQPSDKHAQYELTSYQSRVYPVVRLPHLSTEPDAVRNWLLTGYQSQSDVHAIFLLTDGLALRFPGDLSDPKKYDFDVPLDSYRKLTFIELGSKKITIVTLLPTTSEKYDCAPASTWIKRLLKLNHSSIDFPFFSKAHLQNLTHFITEHEPENSAYLRALTQLGEVAASREFLGDMTQQLLLLPAVQAQIDAEKKTILASYESEQEQLRLAIMSLADKKAQLDAEIEKQKKVIKNETDRLRKAVLQQETELDFRIRETFKNASQAGVETLAQTALLRALIANTTPPASQPEYMINTKLPVDVTLPLPQSQPIMPTMAIEITTKRRLLIAIEEQASATGISETLLCGLIASANVAPIVGLTGKHAKKVIASLANIMSGGIWGEVSIHGDLFSISDLLKSPTLVRSIENTSSMMLGDFLTHQQSNGLATVVELRGFNRMPPETLLPELNDCLFSNGYPSGFSWTDEHHALRHLSISHPILFVLTFAVGKSTFPLLGPIAHRLPVFLAETAWGDERPADQSTDIALTYMTSATWQFLNTDPHQSANCSGSEQQTIQAVLKAFGFSEEKSQAIDALALGAGRSNPEKMASGIESLATALMNEITHGEAATVLDCLFQSSRRELL